MALSGLHTNWIYGSYQEDRDTEVKISENDILFSTKTSDLNAHCVGISKTHPDGVSIDVGYGYDLFQNLNNLITDLQQWNWGQRRFFQNSLQTIFSFIPSSNQHIKS